MAAELDAATVAWVRTVTGGRDVTIERRSAGGSRAGYAVDVRDGERAGEYWLRRDTGVGPQSGGPYTLAREAAVYRQLLKQGLRVAEVVAVHPDGGCFLMKRLPGRNWFSEVVEPREREQIAAELMEQLAALHRIDVRSLDLPELGPVRTMREHVEQEIAIWEAQFRAHDDPEPTIELALAWLRRSIPDDAAPVVLVQGDTGPGNFMFDDGHLVAVTDWELAHFGDRHDDLAWIYVHDLQERFENLPRRLAEYERLSGLAVDPVQLRYFLVLAQARCAIGTRAGLLARDSRGEIASHLIYTTLHTRALADALVAALGADVADPGPLPPTDSSAATWMYDVALADLRDTVVPAVTDGFASRRAKGVARLVKYLRERDRLRDAIDDDERDALDAVLAERVTGVEEGRRLLCEQIRAGRVPPADAVAYCARHWARRVEVLRPAMGVLADRRYSPLP